uniref:Gypsy retrotransposon integrase-like protein 1-like n=1 Tax=Saccoglossus kowalevskii TaxID=10224 RepID=A0ABM0M6D3_SACKO|nr:PREDICTED: gypsy retrotransposon integrase-like protein 1-like [Saccoglossus kowalevskii]
MEALHDDVGHLGQDRSLDLMRSRFYWPGMTEMVVEWIKSCERCTCRKMTAEGRAPVPLVSIKSTRLLELVCMDYLSIEPSKRGCRDVLVITDHFTKYAIAVSTRNQIAKVTADALMEQFVRHIGFPERLHSDQGRNFESAVIRHLCDAMGVVKCRSTPYHALGCGITERFNQMLLGMLETLSNSDKQNWKQHVSAVTHAYNCTKHDVTGYTPYFLTHGHHPRLPVDIYLGLVTEDEQTEDMDEYVRNWQRSLDEAYQIVSLRMDKKSLISKSYYDRKARQSELSPGDRVLMRNVKVRGKHKLADQWEKDPYVIVRQDDRGIPFYVVKPEKGW